MGLLTLILIAIIILVIIGIGAGTFLSGLWNGVEKVGSNPVIQNLTEQGKQFFNEKAQNTTSEPRNTTIGAPT
jgi:hypothetical protein